MDLVFLVTSLMIWNPDKLLRTDSPTIISLHPPDTPGTHSSRPGWDFTTDGLGTRYHQFHLLRMYWLRYLVSLKLGGTSPIEITCAGQRIFTSLLDFPGRMHCKELHLVAPDRYCEDWVAPPGLSHLTSLTLWSTLRELKNRWLKMVPYSHKSWWLWEYTSCSGNWSSQRSTCQTYPLVRLIRSHSIFRYPRLTGWRRIQDWLDGEGVSPNMVVPLLTW